MKNHSQGRYHYAHYKKRMNPITATHSMHFLNYVMVCADGAETECLFANSSTFDKTSV